MRLSIALTNTKPGTGKTTTATLLAYAFHRRGNDVLLADCDPAQSALAWSDEIGGLPFKVVGLAVRDAGRRLADYAGPNTIVIADMAQAEDHGAIARSVLRSVDEITVPVAPTMIEIERTSAITELLEEVAEVRQVPARTAMLLNRVVGSARSGTDTRDALTQMGYAVLDTEIPRREVYAQAYGAEPVIRDGDPIDALATEYLKRAGNGEAA